MLSRSTRSLLALVALVVTVGAGMQGLKAWHRAQLGDELAALAQPGDIHLLSSQSCTYCTAARQWLSEHRVAFDECFIERDAACRTAFDAAGVGATPTVLVRGRVQAGFDAERVLSVLRPG